VYEFASNAWNVVGSGFVIGQTGVHSGQSVAISADGKKVAVGAPEYMASLCMQVNTSYLDPHNMMIFVWIPDLVEIKSFKSSHMRRILSCAASMLPPSKSISK
jgi:hypothetical protein